MAVPVPISRLRAGLRPIRRPSQVVKTSVPTKLTATTAITGRPSALMDAKETENPSRATPTRSSFLVTWPSCRVPVRGSSPRLRGGHAQADRPGEDADLGDEPVTEHRPTESEGQDSETQRCVEPGRSGPVEDLHLPADGRRHGISPPPARA